MAVPAFLASSFSYRVDAGVADVADTIIALRDELLNQQTPAWTEPIGGTFRSPPDGNGRFFEFDILRISAVRLSMVVRDDTGTEILDGTAEIDVTDVVRLFTGQFYCQIEFENHQSANFGEALGCGITDLTPEPSDAVRSNIWAHARRNAAGALQTNTDSWAEFFMIDNGVVAASGRARSALTAGNLEIEQRTHTGSIITQPVELNSTPKGNPSGFQQPIGRVHQYVMCSGEFAHGAELTVPIDDALTGVFKVTVRAELTQLAAWRIA